RQQHTGPAALAGGGAAASPRGGGRLELDAVVERGDRQVVVLRQVAAAAVARRRAGRHGGARHLRVGKAQGVADLVGEGGLDVERVVAVVAGGPGEVPRVHL